MHLLFFMQISPVPKSSPNWAINIWLFIGHLNHSSQIILTCNFWSFSFSFCSFFSKRDITMSPQKPILFLLFIILVSFGSCFGSHVEYPLYKENLHGYYDKHFPRHGKFINPRHQHYGLMTRSDRAYEASMTSPAAVNVDDFGASQGEGGDATNVKEN